MDMPIIRTPTDFKLFTGDLTAHSAFRPPVCWGVLHVNNGKEGQDRLYYPILNGRGQNIGSFALYAYAAGLFEDAHIGLWSEPELALEITPELVETLIEGYAPYLAEAEGDKHLNAQVAKFLEDQPLADYKLVIMFEDVPPTSRLNAYLKLAAWAKGLLSGDELNLEGWEKWFPEQVEVYGEIVTRDMIRRSGAAKRSA